MEGRIDPPSSMLKLTQSDLENAWEVWAIGSPIHACVVLSPEPNALYIGKLAVDAQARGRGLARALVVQAESRAKYLDLPFLRLETRVELVENHAAFEAMGFRVTGQTAHDGFDRPTSVTMHKDVAG